MKHRDPFGFPIRGTDRDLARAELELYGPKRLVGYARVSTKRQHERLQLDALSEAGCDPIYVDKASSSRARPELRKALDDLQERDVLVVWKLDRLARSVPDLRAILGDLTAWGVGFRCLTQDFDTTTSMGRLVLTILGAVAEFERDLIAERVREGQEAARRRGHLPGRPPSINIEQLRMAREQLASGTPKAEVARVLGVSRPALYRALART